MSDSTPTIQQLIDRIVQLRWGLLPPYCMNGDEDERSYSDYLKYYSGNAPSESLSATEEYLTALQTFKLDPDASTFFSDVIRTRRRFIASFPFVEDELAALSPDRLLIAEKQLRKVYELEVSKRLIEWVSEYRAILKELICLLK